jgi:iron complex outermembrane receptor protein
MLVRAPRNVGRGWRPLVLASAVLIVGAPTVAEAAPAETTLSPVTVAAPSPLPGTAIDADKLAGEVQTLNVQSLAQDRRIDGIAGLAAGQLASVSLDNEQGSPFQPDFTFRGFEASPISGVAEGLAVYQDGVRLNEAFGDNVNWDLVPAFAVRGFAVQSNNPVFGLNALGGAVTLTMKDGLTRQDKEIEVSGGSFGDVAGHAEYGARLGDFGVYLGVGALHDDGFRDHSPTTLRQAFGDLAYKHGGLTLHLTASGALDDIDAVGPTPVERLARNRRATFTYPQAMRNAAGMVQLRGAYQQNDRLTVSGQVYYRRFAQRLVDGNTTDVHDCGNDAAQLCLGGTGEFPRDALYDRHGNLVPASVLPDGATPGEIDVTRTVTDTLGAAGQVTLTAPIAGHANTVVVGASADHGQTRYTALGGLGWLRDDLRVMGAGVIIDQGLSPTASPPIESPVDVKAANTYAGVYAIDVFDVTPALSLTLSGRWNKADISLRDQTGGVLNADHGFSRFNPGVGLSYKISPALTAYAGYSEANRAPTAGELSCADPTSPCLLDAFLVSDPPLKQVVARTVEAGLRGRSGAGEGGISWTISGYRTESRDDILLLATAINGFGYFQNAGMTIRQGVDAAIGYRGQRLSVRASYAFLDATFADAEALSSNSPAADDDGLIHVRPGDRLPMNPAHRFTLSADYDVTSAWRVGADLRWQSGQYLVGDESNQEPKLPGYAKVTVRARYQLGPHLELFGEIENLFDARYAAYGAFAALDGLPPSVSLTNPRTYSPAEGRAFIAGARARF